MCDYINDQPSATVATVLSYDPLEMEVTTVQHMGSLKEYCGLFSVLQLHVEHFSQSAMNETEFKLSQPPIILPRNTLSVMMIHSHFMFSDLPARCFNFELRSLAHKPKKASQKITDIIGEFHHFPMDANSCSPGYSPVFDRGPMIENFLCASNPAASIVLLNHICLKTT